MTLAELNLGAFKRIAGFISNSNQGDGDFLAATVDHADHKRIWKLAGTYVHFGDLNDQTATVQLDGHFTVEDLELLAIILRRLRDGRIDAEHEGKPAAGEKYVRTDYGSIVGESSGAVLYDAESTKDLSIGMIDRLVELHNGDKSMTWEKAEAILQCECAADAAGSGKTITA